MKNNSAKTKVFKIKETCGEVLGNKVYYRLYCVRRIDRCYYMINVAYCNENSSWCFGKNKQAALRMYNKIVKNSVTPCTLKYIAQDYKN